MEGTTLRDPFGGVGLRWEAAVRESARHANLGGFIAESYRRHFGANLFPLMPELCALVDADGVPRAVAGFRHAGAEALFLEQYLDAPVEEVLGRLTGEHVERSGVWEVGNLATRCPGAARQFIHRAALALSGRGATWAVFTATRRVAAVFRRVGVPLIQLGEAEPGRLLWDGTDWGSYYDHAPRVLAGRVATGLVVTAGAGR